MGVVGIIPAAGRANRMGNIPKFLLPIPAVGQFVPNRTVLADLLTRMQINTLLDRLIMPVAGDWWDAARKKLPEWAFVTSAPEHPTMNSTLLSLRTAAGEDDVAFGMPDTYWQDNTVYPTLLRMLDDGADVAVAVWRARPGQHQKLGMVAFDGNDHVLDVVDKPTETALTYGWGALAWKAKFWDYLQPADPHVGYAIMPAVNAGLKVRVHVCAGDYWDLGTPEEYFDLIKAMWR